MKTIFTVEKAHTSLIGQHLQLAASGEWQYLTLGQGVEAAIHGARQFETYEAARAVAIEHRAQVAVRTEKQVRLAANTGGKL